MVFPPSVLAALQQRLLDDGDLKLDLVVRQLLVELPQEAQAH